VPVLVGDFPDQVLQALGVVGRLGIAQGSAVGTQAAAQGLELVGQVVRCLGFAHSKLA
jgi:hypothetical protein